MGNILQARTSTIESLYWTVTRKIDYLADGNVARSRSILDETAPGRRAELAEYHRSHVTRIYDAYGESMLGTALAQSMTAADFDNFANLIPTFGEECCNEVVNNPGGITALVIMKAFKVRSYLENFGWVFDDVYEEILRDESDSEDDSRDDSEDNSEVDDAGDSGSDATEDESPLREMYRLSKVFKEDLHKLMEAVENAIDSGHISSADGADGGIITLKDRLETFRYHLGEVAPAIDTIESDCSGMLGMYH